jgi:hypothetical protein
MPFGLDGDWIVHRASWNGTDHEIDAWDGRATLKYVPHHGHAAERE